MNKQQHTPESFETSSLMDTLAENPVIKWVSYNGRLLAWFLLGGLALALIAYRLLGGSSALTGEDYFQAERLYQTFQASTDPNTRKDALDKLTATLSKHPDLQSKYDGLIAQILLVRGEYQHALPFAERTLKRTGKDRLSFYGEYAQTSLLIADKKYQEALKAAQQLKQNLEAVGIEKLDVQDFGPTLYAFNLLRMAVLHQTLNNKSEELKAWQEFKQAKAFAAHPEAFNQMVQVLGNGNVTLLNYIEAREKATKS